MPAATVSSVKTAQAALTTPAGASTLVAQITAANAAAGNSGVLLPSAASLVLKVPHLATHVVSAVAPTVWSIPKAALAGSPVTITVSECYGLQLGPEQDAAKVVLASATCASAHAVGTTEVTNLGPADNVGATTAQFQIVFTHVGVYKVCYKLSGSAYEMVGTGLLTVNTTIPVALSYSGEVATIATKVFTMTGGHGLQLAPWYDSAKIIAVPGTCFGNAAGGTTVITDLGPDDNSGATAATAQFTWQQVGKFQLCYRALGGNYTKVLGFLYAYTHTMTHTCC
jgi:hypothetical protein